MKHILLALSFIAGIAPLQAIIVENKTDTKVQLFCNENSSDIQENKVRQSQSIKPGELCTCYWLEFLIKASDRTYVINKKMIADRNTRIVVEMNKILGEVTVTLKNEEICYGDYEF